MTTSRRRWRDYATPSGRRPVKAFIAELSDADAAAIAAAMKEVAVDGLQSARHLRGDIYEVRADGSSFVPSLVRDGGPTRHHPAGA